MRYSPERKEAVLRKMAYPNNRPIRQLAEEEGISEATLFNWPREAREKGVLMPEAGNGPEGWNARDKFAAVLESASLNENELAEYCRKKSIFPEQVAQWRKACENANDRDREQNLIAENRKCLLKTLMMMVHELGKHAKLRAFPKEHINAGKGVENQKWMVDQQLPALVTVHSPPEMAPA